MKFFDAFSGVGGFRIGFEAEGFECVGYSEIDKWAIELYSAYFGDGRNYGDITKIDPKELPDFDVITAGVPCQPFSFAGKRKGLEDPRGMPLWRALFKIIEYKKPKFVVIENVKGLLSSNKGWDFGWVLYQMAELGYDIEWAVLNSKDFNVPQKRERVYIVGYTRGDGKPKIFPFGESEKAYYQPPRGKGRFQAVPNISNTLRAVYYRLGNEGPYIVVDANNIRKLTPLECFRLQGFPDDIVYKARELGISDIQLYKMAGNAVTVQIPQTIARRIKLLL